MAKRDRRRSPPRRRKAARPRRRTRTRSRGRGRALWLGFGLLLLMVVLISALPVVWMRSFPPPTTAFMLRSHYADPATGRACAGIEWSWVDWARISTHLRLAVVVAEDQRFLQHAGFDFDSIADALEERMEEGRSRGASTLTQQLAKNLFLWPGQSWLRKGIEAWYTVWLEQLWPKRRILEVYLNVAQFGPCVFGAEAASRRYFEVSAAELSDEQAALLAAVLPNPLRLRAHNPGPYAQERSAEILALMASHRWLLHGI